MPAMAHRATLLCLLLAALAGTSLAQNDLLRYVSKVPQCGVTCILQEVPKSVCGTLSNSTCLCTDPAFYAAAQACVLKTCESPLDAMETARVEAEACQRPYRDRRIELTPALVILILGFIAVWLRLYTRWATFESFEIDDWMMLVCAILYTPFTVIGQYGGRIAFGRDIWTVDPVDLTMGLKLFYIAQSFYLVCLALTKVSLLCFFLRIFPNQKFRWATHTTILITALSTTIFVFIQIFQCMPVAFNWEGWKGDFGAYQCVDLNALVVAAASFSIALDVIILVLPIPLLVGLNMSWRSKASILLMFSLGIFIIVTACVRLRYILLYRRSVNPTWDHTDVLIWSGFEVSVSMIVTSLPAIRMLLAKSVPMGFSTFLSKTGLSGQPGSSTKKTSSGFKSADAAGGDTKNREELHRDRSIEPGHQRLVSKFNIYKMGARNTGTNESEEQLELGDRARGNVYTEIAVADIDRGDRRGRDPFSDDLVRHNSVESGIHVQTTTRIDSIRGTV